MKLGKLALSLLAGAALLLVAGSARAQEPPESTDPCSENSAVPYSGCSVLFTINPDGSISAAYNPGLYEDDSLVGVINNSNSTVTSLFIHGDEPFGFSTPIDPPASEIGVGYGLGPTGYEGEDIAFDSNLDGSEGTVHFLGNGLESGEFSWFALEGPSTPDNIAAPEPSSLLLLGFGLAGVWLLLGKLKA
jgi:hypothetical protein